ncbi:MAG: site-2 protease family protein [Synechococcaceae cyanobacterium]|nr:site-2 protease family protein [Synechococcaceae cyanobacterium]
MGEGWELLRIRGIPLRIHPTWFVILAIATLAFQEQYRSRFDLTAPLGDAGLWLIAFATAILLFVSVLLHELGHSLVALSQGVRVRDITLFLLGGVASVERDCPTARGALLVAAAGPAVSLLLASLLLGFSHQFSHLSPPLGAMASQLGVLNLVLGLFNLLPGLPLDGGLIVKALVWQVTGSRRKGIEVANASGRLLALMAIGLGAVLLLRGAGLGGAWLMLLGWFGLGSARNQRQMLVVQEALQQLRVRDAARRRFRVLESSDTLRDISRLRLQNGTGAGAPAAEDGWPDWLLVCDRGRWQGVIDDAPLQALPVQRWDVERIGDHLQPLDTLPSIRESAPLWEAALQLEDTGTTRLLVLSAAGLPCGTIQRPEIGEAVLQRLGLRLPETLLSAARRQNSYPLGLALGQVARGMVNSGDVALPESSPSASVPSTR